MSSVAVPPTGFAYYRRRDYLRRALWALCQPLWRWILKSREKDLQ